MCVKRTRPKWWRALKGGVTLSCPFWKWDTVACCSVKSKHRLSGNYLLRVTNLPISSLKGVLHLKISMFCAQSSSIASPICQEGQSERTFPILAFSSWFFLVYLIFSSLFSQFFPLFFLIFDNFFAVEGGTLPRLPPYWLRHWLYLKIINTFFEKWYMHLIVNCPRNSKIASKFRLTKRFLSYWSKQHFDCWCVHHLAC